MFWSCNSYFVVVIQKIDYDHDSMDHMFDLVSGLFAIVNT